MIKKHSTKMFLDKMNFRKSLSVLVIFLASISMVSAQDATNVNLFENSPNDGATITGDDVTFDYGIEEFNTQEGTLELRSDTCVASGEVLQTNTPPTGTSTTYSHTQSYEDCYGTFNWYLFYEGADGSTTDSGIYPSFTVQSDASQLTSFSTSNPADNSEFDAGSSGNADITFEVAIGTPQDKGDVELVVDGVVVHTWNDVTPGTSQVLTTTESISSGNHAYNARFIGVDDSATTTSTKDFTVNSLSDQVNFDLSDPEDGQVISPAVSDLTFSYGGSGGGDGTLNLYLDGQQIESNNYFASTSNAYSTTINVPDAGVHEWYLEYIGDDGSEKLSTAQTFTIQSESSPTFNLQSPNDGETILKNPSDSTAQVNYQGSFEADFSGTYTIVRDNGVVYEDTFSSGTVNYDYTEKLSTGNYSYYILVESDDTLETYTSSSRDFSVQEAEEEIPLIYNRNPSQGETFTYSNANSNGANITFEGDVNAPYTGNGTLTVYNGTEEIDFKFNHTPESTNVQGNAVLPEGNYDYQIFLTSDQTGKTYYTNLTEFDVQETVETRPVQNLDAPLGTFSREIFDRTLEYNTSVEADYNTTNTLKILYPVEGPVSGVSYEQVLFKDQFIEPGQTLGANLFSLTESEATSGIYTVRLKTTSEVTGINYTKTETFEVTSEPAWLRKSPDNTSVEVDGLENFKDTNFIAEINNVEPGTLIYQLKKPGTDEYTDIYETTIESYGDYELDFNKIVEGITYPVNVNGTLYSQNYSTRVLYQRDSETETYTSPVSVYDYKGTPGLIDRAEQWANDTFGEYGTVILATMIILLSSVYIGLFTNGSAVLLTVIAEATTFSIIGWYPGWVAFLLFMFGIGIGYKLFQDGGG